MSYDQNSVEQQLDAIVNDIFSSSEFINFIEAFRNNLRFEAEVVPNENNDNDNEIYDDGEYDEINFQYFYPENLDLDLDLDLEDERDYLLSTTFINPLAASAEVITEFDSFPYTSEDETQKIECSICLVDFENQDDVVLLDCNHMFHNTCILEWCSHKADCPNCREKIKN